MKWLTDTFFSFLVASVSIVSATKTQAIPYSAGCKTIHHQPQEFIDPIIHPVSWIAGNKPICLDVFLDQMGEAAAQSPSKARDYVMLGRAAQVGERNVKTLVCDDGIASATFVTDRVFVTAAHSFYDTKKDSTGRDDYGTKFDLKRIGKCYVEKINPRTGKIQKNYVDIRIEPAMGVPSDNDISADHAVAVVRERMDGIVPIGFPDERDLLVKQQLVSAAPKRDPDYDWVKDCFSVTNCGDDIYNPFPPNPSRGWASFHLTNCPKDKNTSGAGVFGIVRDSSGSPVSVGLFGIITGGTHKGPNGSPFKYAKGMPPGTMWTTVLGVDGLFRQNVQKIIEQTERQN
jgi:hypothetical protein